MVLRNSRIWRDFFKGSEKAHSTERSMLFSGYYKKLKKNGLDQIYVRLILKRIINVVHNHTSSDNSEMNNYKITALEYSFTPC